jgi:hypothetical protein
MRPIAGKSLWRATWRILDNETACNCIYVCIRRVVCIGDECHMTGEILVLDWGQCQLQESLRFKAHINHLSAARACEWTVYIMVSVPKAKAMTPKTRCSDPRLTLLSRNRFIKIIPGSVE